jgi:hypothetical protein
MSDSVRHPKHYELEGLNGIESIDIIRSVLGKMGFEQFCRGNELKYLIRADKKNGLEDLRKAQVYLGWEIDTRGKRESEMSELPEETRTTIDSHMEKPSEVKFEVQKVVSDDDDEKAPAEEPETEESAEEPLQVAEPEKVSDPEPEEAPAETEPVSEKHKQAEALAATYFNRKKKHHGRPSKYDWDKITSMYKQGYPIVDISEACHCPQVTISARKSKHPEEFVKE